MPSLQPALVRAALVSLTTVALSITGTLFVSTPHAGALASFRPRLTSYDQQLVNDINRARQGHHIASLQLVAGTTDVAHAWSCVMAGHQRVAHRPYLGGALSRHGSPWWRHIGENVAVVRSSDPNVLFHAYMNSYEHRANILNPRYHYLGVRTMHANGREWNTLDFVDEYRYAYGATRQTC